MKLQDHIESLRRRFTSRKEGTRKFMTDDNRRHLVYKLFYSDPEKGLKDINIGFCHTATYDSASEEPMPDSIFKFWPSAQEHIDDGTVELQEYHSVEDIINAIILEGMLVRSTIPIMNNKEEIVPNVDPIITKVCACRYSSLGKPIESPDAEVLIVCTATLYCDYGEFTIEAVIKPDTHEIWSGGGPVRVNNAAEVCDCILDRIAEFMENKNG